MANFTMDLATVLFAAFASLCVGFIIGAYLHEQVSKTRLNKLKAEATCIITDLSTKLNAPRLGQSPLNDAAYAETLKGALDIIQQNSAEIGKLMTWANHANTVIAGHNNDLIKAGNIIDQHRAKISGLEASLGKLHNPAPSNVPTMKSLFTPPTGWAPSPVPTNHAASLVEAEKAANITAQPAASNLIQTEEDRVAAELQKIAYGNQATNAALGNQSA